jgi:hypothetical protein
VRRGFILSGEITVFVEFATRGALALGTIFTARTVFTTGTVAFGAFRAVFTAGAVFTTATLRAVFTTRTVAFAAFRAAFATRTAVIATAFGTFRAPFATRAAVTTAVTTTAFATLGTGTPVITATAFATFTSFGTTALGAAFAASATQHFVEFDRLEAELRGHFLDDGLLEQIKNGFEAQENDEGRDQRCRREGQSEIRERIYHEERFLGSMCSGGGDVTLSEGGPGLPD